MTSDLSIISFGQNRPESLPLEFLLDTRVEPAEGQRGDAWSASALAGKSRGCPLTTTPPAEELNVPNDL